METPTPPADHRFDAAGTLVVDQTCRRCGYNLRGLHRDGRCPECGTPIGLSVRGDLLRYADPSWVERLARGSKFILRGLTVALLAAIGFMAGAWLVFSGMTTTTKPSASPQLDLLTALVTVPILLGMLAFYYGIWLMTSPDPTRVGEDLYATSRKLVRITLLIGIGDLAVQAIAEQLTLPAPVQIALAIIGIVAGLGGLVGFLAYLRYLSKLALRIPDQPLSKRARFLFVAFIFTPAVWVALLSASMLLSYVASAELFVAPAVSCGTLLFLLAMLVFTLMMLRLQYRIGQACREQAGIARTTWASPNGAETA
jgi:hypothetical protein